MLDTGLGFTGGLTLSLACRAVVALSVVLAQANEERQLSVCLRQKLSVRTRHHSGHRKNAVIGCAWCKPPRNLSEWRSAKRSEIDRFPVPIVASALGGRNTWLRMHASIAANHGRFQRIAPPLAPNAAGRCIGWGEHSKRQERPTWSSGRRLSCFGGPVSGSSRIRAGNTWSLIRSAFVRSQRSSNATVSIHLG